MNPKILKYGGMWTYGGLLHFLGAPRHHLSNAIAISRLIAKLEYWQIFKKVCS